MTTLPEIAFAWVLTLWISLTPRLEGDIHTQIRASASCSPQLSLGKGKSVVGRTVGGLVGRFIKGTGKEVKKVTFIYFVELRFDSLQCEIVCGSVGGFQSILKNNK